MLTTPIVLAVLLQPASVQFGDAWLELTASGGSLDVPAAAVSGPGAEVDLAAGDLDQDGCADLVAVRKEPFGTAGARANLLFLSEEGVLRDRTAAFASASDVPGDQGFLTPTADRDVVLADVDLDGWLDVVTAVTNGAGLPKHLSHPRVYRNLGASGGAWLGLRHEDARVPVLLHAASGLPVPPRFTSVAAGDVDLDGAPDLYFGDGDVGPTGLAPPEQDLDDRLLVNDGAGWFHDGSALALPSSALSSIVAMDVAIADLDGDGAQEIVKDEGFGTTAVTVFKNDPASPGTFASLQVVASQETYGFELGDLNGDGRLDAVLADNGPDLYLYNLGTDAAGQVVWSSPHAFAFLAGVDDGIATNPHVADLDGDGWNDVVIADVSVLLPGFDRRAHVYHNPGGTPGAEITLVEEREDAAEPPTGWLGAVGLHEPDLKGTYDVATLDVDQDQDLDLVLARSTGTHIWLNQTVRNALIADSARISLAAGGTQAWTLAAGPAHANELYVVLGSLSGTSPGLPLGAVTVPLNPDAWFQFTLAHPSQPPLAGTLGLLDAKGKGSAALAVPPGTNPGLAGLLLHHALVTVDLGTLQPTSASQPVALWLEP